MALRASRLAGGIEAPEGTPFLFATANGEINTIGTILESLEDPGRSVSPTHFHNSVHNASPGYWSISSKRRSPSTTLTMGELSFEYAVLDAWARLSCDESTVQVTAGDEAVEGPAWADPAHCTHDLCGSLMLSSDAGQESTGRLLHVRIEVPVGPDSIQEACRSLVERFGPSEVVEDFRCTGGGANPVLPEGATNPCGAVYFALRFLKDPNRGGRLLLLKTGRGGDLSSIVMDKS